MFNGNNERQILTDPMLVQGRAKLIEQDNAKRYKLLTKDDNEVDSIFVDNRGVNANGKTLVICSEGNREFEHNSVSG